jgi:hypothetical protein
MDIKDLYEEARKISEKYFQDSSEYRETSEAEDNELSLLAAANGISLTELKKSVMVYELTQ